MTPWAPPDWLSVPLLITRSASHHDPPHHPSYGKVFAEVEAPLPPRAVLCSPTRHRRGGRSRAKTLKSLESCADATLGATEDEVLCKVHLEYVKIPDTDKWFDNGGTYTLYLSVATIASNVASHLQTQSCPTTDVSRIYPKIVLAKYEGCGNFANTPEWAQREPGVESVFRETKSALADLLSRVTSKQLEIDGSFVDQLAAMRIS
ncbi:hypothetical protein BDY19DRAFT_995380 [Irpex rosettiformis]|uniref:Uncharacterized protein n=1 Tax=Irpex rosettiformis TaxID=378272 RepID=A0ACB8TY66_9APHY|nr:hypothetical protein BDY19DRAFT_995380 [Irpex rosettiformis]